MKAHTRYAIMSLVVILIAFIMLLPPKLATQGFVYAVAGVGILWLLYNRSYNKQFEGESC
jgi:hypothetical protein